MLRQADAILGHHLHATDGEIGRVHDLYFDDETWTVRYLAVDTGTWLPGRRVLISPDSAGEPRWDNQTVPVDLTKEAIKNSPPIASHEPVSVQQEQELAHYFGWAPYWTTLGGMWGGGPGLPVTPSEGGALVEGDQPQAERAEPEGPALRSVRKITGYHISASDGEIGHVEDFIVDVDDAWTLRYLVVDTRNWLPGRKVLLALDWVDGIDWYDKHVEVDLSKEVIRNAPQFDAEQPVNREYETRLYDYYGRPAYWQ